MQPAPELEQQVGRLYQALSSGDFATLERMISAQADVLVIGTDPQEWWEDRAHFLASMRRRMQEMGTGIPVVASTPRAYSEGAIGWVADRARYQLPNGGEYPFRATFVFRREDGAWRLIQWHVSFAVRNEDVQREAAPAG
ncbi:MAG TPA: nuclear transport factor 2 family protein [Chloroflexota bacterium]|jgi:ketosteroid isomerase-like protein|nr:nuclear transport factor 2 family protein [Chloroflexota bacterium]